MPIITKTAESITRTYDNIFFEMALNKAKSIAMAVGTECHLSSSSTPTKKQYYVPLDAIGYSGWCISITCFQKDSSVGDRLRFDIYLANSDGTPNINDPNVIGDYFGTSSTNTANSYPYAAETCVMISDDNKDTVLFDLHPGSTTHGTDLKSDRSAGISDSFFIARDVNNDVVCGHGQGNIIRLRGSDSTLSATSLYKINPQQDDITQDILHLTKMVNYLSPGCPEMKSAYVSVVRPLEKIDKKRYVSTLYVNGKRWGRVGYLDSWIQNDEEHPGYNAYYPFSPFVNY